MFKTVNELKTVGEWDSFYVSGKGLAPVIAALGDNLVGLELGVARAETAYYLLENCPNIKTYYAIDPWLPYMDWNGMISVQLIADMKMAALANLSHFENKVKIVEENSGEAEKKIKKNSLDFIFIDGDHAYESALFDMTTYWPKVKKGGLFAGHDAGMATVDKALVTFREAHDIKTPVQFCDNQCWYWVKE
jgi:hypothetical protein